MDCTVFETRFGWVGVAGTSEHVSRVLLPCPNRDQAAGRLGRPPTPVDALPPLLREVVARIQRYFTGTPVGFDEPIDLSSFSVFAQTVLEACRRIDYGTTCSYRDLAVRCGRPTAARAVGMVMARNPAPILVPCHRVIRTDGSLGGFGGGLTLKRRMLQLERTAISR